MSIKFIEAKKDKITLVTPADKEENISFYTKKCGFKVTNTKMDGNVKVVHLLKERLNSNLLL